MWIIDITPLGAYNNAVEVANARDHESVHRHQSSTVPEIPGTPDKSPGFARKVLAAMTELRGVLRLRARH